MTQVPVDLQLVSCTLSCDIGSDSCATIRACMRDATVWTSSRRLCSFTKRQLDVVQDCPRGCFASVHYSDIGVHGEYT